MPCNRRFSSLVVAALVSWAAVAGALAVTPDGDRSAPSIHTVAATFPTAEAGFASHATPAAN